MAKKPLRWGDLRRTFGIGAAKARPTTRQPGQNSAVPLGRCNWMPLTCHARTLAELHVFMPRIHFAGVDLP
jgi:hypothetical protein